MLPTHVHPQIVPPVALGCRSVLVVEDDQGTGTLLRSLLSHYEFSVKVARTVAQAIGHLADTPAFALIDLNLPDGDGVRVLEEINDAKLTTKAIVVTGCTDAARIRRVQRLRPVAILTKPANILTVLEHLKA